MTTVICEQREISVADTPDASGALWLAVADCERATGFTLKPEGLCRDHICVPLRPGQGTELVRDGVSPAINMSGLWQRLGHPVVHDSAGEIWVLGTAAGERTTALQSLEAPDFSLPDLEGRPQSLHALRGKKVWLSTWASW